MRQIRTNTTTFAIAIVVLLSVAAPAFAHADTTKHSYLAGTTATKIEIKVPAAPPARNP